MGYSPCGHKELDMTQRLIHTHLIIILFGLQMSKYIKCGKVGLDTGVFGFEQYMQILELRYFRCPVPSFSSTEGLM